MISFIQGTLHSVHDNSIVVLVGGVGLQLLVPAPLIGRIGEIGQMVELPTALVVREDSMTLYGFSTPEERTVFEMLQGVSGIGPRLALAVLSGISIDMLANAIQNDEPEVIARVPGLGKKTAQKLILELRGKISPSTVTPGISAVTALDTEVIDALTSLGYSIIEAQAALQSIPADAPLDVEERVRLALGYFYG